MAVKKSRPKLTKILAEAGPAEALTLEDGVGNTPFEYAARQAFLARLNAACGGFMPPADLNLNYQKKPFDLPKQEAELPRLRAAIDQLLREGRLNNGTKLTKELVAFADRLEAKIAKEKAAAEAKEKEQGAGPNPNTFDNNAFVKQKDNEDIWETLKVLKEVIEARPTLRQLIQLSDVHQSVTMSLQEYQHISSVKENKQDDDGIPEEKEVTTSRLSQAYDTTYASFDGHSALYWSN